MWTWKEQFTVAHVDGEILAQPIATISLGQLESTRKHQQRIVSLGEEQPFATKQQSKNQLHRQRVRFSERTVCQPTATYIWPIVHRTSSFNMATTPSTYSLQSDETPLPLNSVKRFGWNVVRTKRVVRTVEHLVKVNACSSNAFGRIICFGQKLEAKFVSNIDKYGLLPTVEKQFGPDRTLWKMQEDNIYRLLDRHWRQWKKWNDHQCHLLFLQLKISATYQDQVKNFEIFALANQPSMEGTPIRLTRKSSTSLAKNEFVQNHGDFIWHCPSP